MDPKESKMDWLVSIGQGLAWMVTAFGALASAVFFREALLDIMIWFGVKRLQVLRQAGKTVTEIETDYRITAVDYFVIFVLACLTVWAIVEIEYYFRKGRPKGLLLKRILKVTGIEVGMIIGSILLQILIRS